MKSLLKEGSLGFILYQSQVISEKDILKALQEQKVSGLRFGETLVKQGVVRQEDIDWALSHQLDIPYVRINKDAIDPDIVRLVPAAIARQYQLFPIVQIGTELRIAIADPLDSMAVAAVEKVSGCSVAISLGLRREITEMQDLFYGAAGEEESLSFSSACFPAVLLENINKDLSGDLLLNSLLATLIQEGFSSISCKPLKESVKLTGRKEPLSEKLGTLSYSHYAEFLGTIREKAGISRDGKSISHGIIHHTVEGEQLQFQVLLMQTGPWEYVTLKPLFTAPFPDNLAMLETTAATMEILRRLAALPEGLVLFASTSGEDRARLMGACLQEYNETGKDLLLLGKGFYFCADRYPVLPIARYDLDMSRWIRAALDHDHHIVAAEELIDSAAFSAAFEAVLKGTLLFGGVAAAGILPMLTRLILIRERLPLLSLYLRGVVACRTVRLLCPVCKKPEQNQPAPTRFKRENGAAFRAAGCPTCRFTGYSGSRSLVEAALFDQEFTEVFNRNVTAAGMMTHLRQNGFLSMVESARGMLQAGEITADEYIAVTVGNGADQWPE